jgi:hypothetical protein
MKRIIRLVGLVFICAVGLLSSACVQCESEEVRVNLNENLSGQITFSFKNLSSSEKTTAAKEKEMKDICGDQSKLADALKEAGLKEVTVELSNQTPLKCDAVLQGSFDNILSILSLVAEVEKGDFQMTKANQFFSLRLRAKGLIADSPDLFSLKYTGETLEHNAPFYDTETQTMQWRIKDSDNQSIYFYTKLRPND